jgi:hypothetical protein
MRIDAAVWLASLALLFGCSSMDSDSAGAPLAEAGAGGSGTGGAQATGGTGVAGGGGGAPAQSGGTPSVGTGGADASAGDAESDASPDGGEVACTYQFPGNLASPRPTTQRQCEGPGTVVGYPGPGANYEPGEPGFLPCGSCEEGQACRAGYRREGCSTPADPFDEWVCACREGRWQCRETNGLICHFDSGTPSSDAAGSEGGAP